MANFTFLLEFILDKLGVSLTDYQKWFSQKLAECSLTEDFRLIGKAEVTEYNCD